MDCTVRVVEYRFLFFNYLSFFIGPALSMGSNKRPIVSVFPRATSVSGSVNYSSKAIILERVREEKKVYPCK